MSICNAKPTYDSYFKAYENICLESFLFFNVDRPNDGLPEKRNINSFCGYLHKKNPQSGRPAPYSISRMLNNLVATGHLILLKEGGVIFDSSEYLSLINIPFEKFMEFLVSTPNQTFSKRLNMAGFGFAAIYEYFKDIVRPLVHTTKGVDRVGTCFKTHIGFVTAKHCVEDASSIGIRGLSPQELANCTLLLHEDERVDLAIITSLISGEDLSPEFGVPEVLHEVLVLGYPVVPGYTNFLTAEKSHIAGRLTATTGSINAISENYLLRQSLMLVTARVRPGNSGGPVINNRGQVVGVLTSAPYIVEGNTLYDDMGYGAAIDIQFLTKEFECGKFKKALSRDIKIFKFE